MANIKQKFIKPGRDFNYSEGVKVKNNSTSTAITAGQVLYVAGLDGAFLKVAPALADALTTVAGRLLVAKHDIPADGYGIGLPWQVITMDTSTKAVGNPIYVSHSAAGTVTKTAPTGTGNVVREVGTVIVVGGATAGKALFCGEGAQNLVALS